MNDEGDGCQILDTGCWISVSSVKSVVLFICAFASSRLCVTPEAVLSRIQRRDAKTQRRQKKKGGLAGPAGSGMNLCVPLPRFRPSFFASSRLCVAS